MDLLRHPLPPHHAATTVSVSVLMDGTSKITKARAFTPFPQNLQCLTETSQSSTLDVGWKVDGGG